MIKKTLFAAALAGAGLFGFTAETEATDVVWASEIISVVDGTRDPLIPGRDDETNALGAPDAELYSLGLETGTLVVGFGPGVLVQGDALVIERTGPDRFPAGPHFEAVEVTVFYADATFVTETIFNIETNIIALTPGQVVTSVALSDVTSIEFPDSTSFDGFDVDAVGIEGIVVPSPVAAYTGLSLLGGLVLRRRR